MKATTQEKSDNRREIVRQLRSHGITPTSQRVQIATVMLSRPQHLSAEQVMELANGEGKQVSKATVYNTLGLFAEKGLIRELVVDPTRSFYDSSTHSHHHFFNSETQELTDIPDGVLDLHLPPQLPPNTEIERVEVVVHLRSSS
ncbi:MAG: Fur family transcriptional regulator [Candidatus Sedimenticola sp. (ex Thyasira tokunagai)]